MDCIVCKNPFLKLSSRKVCYNCLLMEKTVYFQIIQHIPPRLSSLKAYCEDCHRSTPCPSHLSHLRRIAKKDEKNEIGFQVGKEALYFSGKSQVKVELLLNLLSIDFLVVDGTDIFQPPKDRCLDSLERIHPGVSLSQAIKDDPHSSLASRVN